MTQPVFRFAPSPNGYLHLGHALSALIDFEMARAAGGRFLLRIEDIDATRCRPEFEAAIYEDLAWLGIAWEEPVRRQSEHLDAYRRALAKLEALGLVYPSFESRAEIARLVARARARRAGRAIRTVRRSIRATRSSLAPRSATRRMAGEPYALRLDMDAAMARTGALTWVEIGADPTAGARHRDGAAGGVGRRGARPQGDADQLSPLGRGRRRAAGRHPRGARAGPASRRPACTACCRRCSACRRRSTIITG